MAIRFDYSMFGLPRLLPTNTVPGSAFGGDIDNDDNINNGLNPDGQSDISDLIAFCSVQNPQLDCGSPTP
jgi:hypothetical protein